jgi:TolA-binding protein/predicted Ser/Thr protein kinase
MSERKTGQPRQIGPYEIVDTLGAGGMSVVYRARQPSLDREVAIKVLSRESSANPEAIARFERESTLVAQLSHPGIIQIFDRGEQGGAYYIVMEYVRGCSLEDLIRERRLEIHEIVDIASQVARALDYAHSKGVVHRDVKPGNVLVSSDSGVTKVADFGIAQLAQAQLRGETITRENIGMGTINYMAPEQRLDARSVDGRADVYSFGVILYEMLTGRLPLGHFKKPEELRDDTPPSLSKIVMRCLQQSPEDRYPGFGPIVEDLAHVTLVNVQYREALAKVAETVRRMSGKARTGLLLRAWRRAGERVTPQVLLAAAAAVLGVGALLALASLVSSLGGHEPGVYGGPFEERFAEAAQLRAAGRSPEALEKLRRIRDEAAAREESRSAGNAQWEIAEIHRANGDEHYAALAYGYFAREFAEGEEFRDSERAPEALYWAGYFRERERRHDYEDAVGYYRRVYEEYPEDPHAPMAMLAAARLMREKLRVPRGTDAKDFYFLAGQLYRRVVDEYPESGLGEKALRGYAELYADTRAVRDYRRAAETYEEMAAAYPESTADPLYRAAEIYERRLDDRKRAVELYQQFLAARPDSDNAERARSRLRSLLR